MTRKRKPAATEDDVAVGRKLKEIRELRGISQENIAIPLGVSFQQVQKYERGTNRIR